MAFYSLCRLLLAHLARLSPSRLHQLASRYHQVLLSLSLNTARSFADLHGNSKQLAASFAGDLFQATAALARCGISAATAGSLADYVDTFLGEASESDNGATRETVSALLSVCMEREPLAVLRTLLQRLNEGCVVTVISTIREYFCHVDDAAVPDLVIKELGGAFSRLVGMNNQVTHRVQDALVAIAMRLRTDCFMECHR